MGILADILGTGEVIEKGLQLIDDMHTSREEEIVATTQAKVDLLTAYHPFKRAQRLLAVMFCGTYILCFFLYMAGALFGVVDKQVISDVMGEFMLGWITLTIIGFYFGGGAFEGMIGKFKGPKTK